MESEESVSIRTDLEFTYWGIRSSLTVNDLARIRKKYDLSGMFSMVVPEAFTNTCTYDTRFVTPYEDALAAGLCLSLHPLAQDLLIYLGMAPG